MIKQMVIILLLSPLSLGYRKIIQVHNGEVTFTGFETCNISCNDYEMTSTNGAFKGLHFGLIDYSCDDMIGVMVSKMICKQCLFFCGENQSILECSSYIIPMMTGCIVGSVILSLLLGISIKTGLFKKLNNAGMIIGTRMFNSRKERKVNRINKMRRQILSRDVEPTYFIPLNEIINNDKKPDVPIRRSEMHDSISGTDAEIVPFNDKVTADQVIEEAEQYRKANRRGSSGRMSMMKVVFVIMNLFLIGASCCDNTLYITSTGVICSDSECNKVNTFDFPIVPGGTICFKKEDGGILTMNVERSRIVNRFYNIYDTSNYDLEIDQTSRCRGAGQCWAGNECSRNTNYEGLKNLTGVISGYGCYMNYNRECDGFCAYSSSCLYYKWFIKESGKRYSVYKHSTKVWEIKLRIVNDNVVQRYTFSTNYPSSTLNLNGAMVPIFITGIDSMILTMDDFGIIVDNTFYSVQASPINMPMTDIIGDYQIDIKNTTSTYNVQNVDCRMNECNILCSIPEPKLGRFLTSLNKHQSYPYKILGDHKTINVFNSIDPSVNVRIGNFDISNLIVSKAKCRIDVMTTYSCLGCTIRPYAVLQANDIKVEGIMQVRSNCKMVNEYVSCTNMPRKLEFDTINEVCELHLINTNETISIKFNTTYVGSLDPSKPLYSAGIDTDDVMSLVKSEGFITGLISTLGLFSVLTIGMTLMSRLLMTVLSLRLAERESSNKV
nr:MAG: glycoprotein [Niukluk phantom virus]